MTSNIQRLHEKVSRILERAGYSVGLVSYPSGERKRSINFIAKKQNRTLLIKAIDDVDLVSENEAKELKSLSLMFKAKGIIVGERSHKGKLEDMVIYERFNIPTITPESLECLVHNGSIYIYAGRGGYYVRIDGKKLKEKRESRRLSLGNVAQLLGLTRKTVYEYERGYLNTTLHKAIRIMDLFGEDVLKPFNLDELEVKGSMEYPVPEEIIEKEIIVQLSSKGFQVVHTKATPIDVAAQLNCKSYRIVFAIKHRREKDMMPKVEALHRIINIIRAKAVAIVSSVSEEKDVESLGICAIREDDLRRYRKADNIIEQIT